MHQAKPDRVSGGSRASENGPGVKAINIAIINGHYCVDSTYLVFYNQIGT